MKIALIGYGKMGQMVEKMALARGHTIVGRMTSDRWEMGGLQDADICIDFTRPESVLENVRKIAALKKAIVVGTTGWDEKMQVVQSLVEEHQIGLLYSPNFSIGVNLLLEILAHASKVFNAFEEYGVAGIEYHHSEKRDSPSGTALDIARTIERNMGRINRVPFSSIRCGSIPGIHTVLFDSPCDTILITHEARSREGFANGALLAAEWLKGKRGVYTFADCMREINKRGQDGT
jgi:4-hydroxy-tetrahydrodipicolinate reductase